MNEAFDAVRACAIVLLDGAVLQAGGVSAGNGLVIDWREVKSGEQILDSADAFDMAYLLVALVGAEAAFAAATRDCDIEPAPPVSRPTTRVHAFAPSYNGGRRRTFEIGPFTVMVEPHEDDAAQDSFTAALAEAAARLA
jgi:hypothetical protein